MTITPALTKADVRAMRPCEDDYKQACQALPDWENTAYTPSQMAAHGVEHSSIIWAWVRNDMMDRSSLIEFACRCAESVLHVFECANLGDDRPRKAIEAARRYALNPTQENKEAVRAAARAALAAADAALAADARDAARAAAWAVDAVAWAARAAAWSALAARADEQSRQIKILEAVIAEANQ